MPSTQSAFFGRPPGPMVRGLLIANVVLYVAELILLRTGASFIDGLFLSPFDVLRKGMVWQVGTYMWFHDPVSPGHLLFNMLWLYIFGTQMEAFWGPKRFLRGYLFFGLGGGLLTVLLGALAYAPGFSSWLDGFQHTRHLGASGAVIGVTVAWGLAHAKTQVNFFLLGAMSGMTFVFLIIGIQLLTALSFSAVSASAHFGGIGAAFILCRGLWRPSRWKQMLRRLQLKRQKRKIQRELRLIRSDDDDKTRWN